MIKKNKSDLLEPELIKKGLKTRLVAEQIHYLKITDSTNTAAMDLAKKGAQDGTLIVAEEQTRGRGRLGREWLSAPYSSLIMSLIFKPDIEPSQLYYITMLSSIAVVNAVKKIAGISAGIKWPNDIYIKNKKVAGILTELYLNKESETIVVVGLGLNVNFDTSIYPEIREIATSMSIETDTEIPRVRLLQKILEEIERGYNFLKNHKYKQIRDEWNDKSMILGKKVKIIEEDAIKEGLAEYIDEEGSLIIINKNGKREKIVCGDVSLRI